MAYIGRKINVGFWKEATRGTVVAIASWTPKTNLDFQQMSEVVNDESSLGVIADSTNSYVTKRWAEGNIEGNVNINNFGYAMLSAFGAVISSETTGTWAYEHDFTVLESNEHPTLTVGIDDPVEWDLAFAGAMLESLEVSAEVGGFVTFTASYKSKKEASATHTVTYTTDYTLLARHCGVKLADTLADLSGASNICIQSFSLSINKNLEEDLCLSSIEPVDFNNTQFVVEGSMTLQFENTDQRDNYLEATQKAMRITIEDTGTTIGVSDSPVLEFDMAKVKITEWTKNQGNDDIVTQDVTFKAFYDLSEAQIITGKLINTKSSY